MAKADGTSKAEVGESLDFKVLEFSKDDRRIVLSHKATWSNEEEDKVVAKPAAGKKQAPKGKTIEKINNETEKSTLGDLDALAALKEKMSGGSSKSE